MVEVNRCPRCGGLLPPEIEPSVTGRPEPEPAKHGTSVPLDEREADVSPPPLLASGSTDDTLPQMPSASSLDPSHAGLIADQPVDSSVISVLDSTEMPFLKRSATSSANFPVLNLDLSSPQNRQIEDSFREESTDETDHYKDESEVQRTPWVMVLLASYASAMTLALVWTLWKDNAREKATRDMEPNPAVVVPSASARQIGLSRKVELPEPILGEHFARFGQPLVIGSLEITPLDVKRQDVQLLRSNPYSPPARREGGKRALILRLKLRNLTNDSVFAPLDQSYVRERGKQIVDTYLQTFDQERIYPFPLAVESEWSIVGQDFTELRPGESRTVAIVSAADAPPDSAGPFTWRVRLRTGINRTDLIGVVWPETPAAQTKPNSPGGNHH